jgi:hypothetical protein
MLLNVDVGWTVLFNDYNGNKCPALVTKVYSPGSNTPELDLHVVGIQNNASFARGKIQVPHGINTVGTWEYSSNREIRIKDTDLPTDGQSLIYNSATDVFETETISNGGLNIDGGIY